MDQDTAISSTEQHAPSLVIVIKETQDTSSDRLSPRTATKAPTPAPQPPGDNNDVIIVSPKPPSSAKDNDDDLEITSVTSESSKEAQKAANLWEEEESLTCAFCQLNFPTVGEFLLHLMIHVDMTCKEHLPLNKTKLCYFGNRYQCYNCKIKTKHRVVFREHVRHHVLKLPYKCGVCSVDMTSLAWFKAHIGSGSCSAEKSDLSVKNTEIVRQVMKMLGPRAPPTEHFYSVGKTGANKDDQSAPSKSADPKSSDVTSKPVTDDKKKEQKNIQKLVENLSSGTEEAQLQVRDSYKIKSDPQGDKIEEKSTKDTTEIHLSSSESLTESLSSDQNVGQPQVMNRVNEDQAKLHGYLVPSESSRDSSVHEGAGNEVTAFAGNIAAVSTTEEVTTPPAEIPTNLNKLNENQSDETTLASSNDQILPIMIPDQNVENSQLATETETESADVPAADASDDESSSWIPKILEVTSGPSSFIPITETTDAEGNETTNADENETETTNADKKETETTNAGINETETTNADKNEIETKIADKNETETKIADKNETKTTNADKNEGETTNAESNEIGQTLSQSIAVDDDDDDIQIIEVTPGRHASRGQVNQVSMGNSLANQSSKQVAISVGKSVDDPIVINDDDLNRVSQNSQNKIKIERCKDGIALHLFRENNGQMESLSQLGLEIRGGFFWCKRCETQFLKPSVYIPHVSEELHRMFNIHSGLCPVCKKTETEQTGVPCKLARILYKLLTVVARSKFPRAMNVTSIVDQEITQLVPAVSMSDPQTVSTRTKDDTIIPTSTVTAKMPTTPSPIVLLGSPPATLPLGSILLPPGYSATGQTQLLIPIPAPGPNTGIVPPVAVLQQTDMVTRTEQAPILVPISAPGPNTGIVPPVAMIQQTDVVTSTGQAPRLVPISAPGPDTGIVPSVAMAPRLVPISASGPDVAMIQQNDMVTSTAQSNLSTITQTTTATTIITATSSYSESKGEIISPAPTELLQSSVYEQQAQAPELSSEIPGSDMTINIENQESQETSQAETSTPSETQPDSQDNSDMMSIFKVASAPAEAESVPKDSAPPAVLADAGSESVPKSSSLAVLADVGSETAPDPTNQSDCSSISSLTNILETCSEPAPGNLRNANFSELVPPTDSDQPVKNETETETEKYPVGNAQDGISSDKDIFHQLMPEALSTEPDKDTLHSSDSEYKNNEQIETKTEVEAISAQEKLEDVTSDHLRKDSVASTDCDADEHSLADMDDDEDENESLASADFIHDDDTTHEAESLKSFATSESGEHSATSTTAPSINGDMPTGGDHAKFIDILPLKKPAPDHRYFLGKFYYDGQFFNCLSCKVRSRTEGWFRKHLNKHIHGRKIGTQFCSHCPKDVIYNRMGTCPLLHKIVRMLKQVAKYHPSQQTKLYNNVESSLTNGMDTGNEPANQESLPKSVSPTKRSPLKSASRDSIFGAGYETASQKEEEGAESGQPLSTDDTNSRMAPYEVNKSKPTREQHKKSTPVPLKENKPTAAGFKFLMKCAVGGCDFKSVDTDAFKLHYTVEHSGATVIACGYCSRVFTTVDSMITHQDEHKDWVYKCSFDNCKFGARKIADYQVHLREIHSNSKIFKCCFCDKLADEIEDILSHTELHVRTVIKCPYCDETSLDKKKVQGHIADCHKDKPKKIVVSTQIIHNLEDLEDHVSANTQGVGSVFSVSQNAPLPTGEGKEREQDVPPVAQPAPQITVKPYEAFKPESCEKCTFVSTNKDMADEHSRLHNTTQDKEKNFYCKHCSYSCDQSSEFKVHLQHHTGTQTLRMYLCAHCDYSSMQMSKIEEHLMEDHPNDPFKFEVSQAQLAHLQLMEPCEICEELVLNTDNKYKVEHVLKCHKSQTTGAPQTSSGTDRENVLIERFHCDRCLYSAPSVQALQEHVTKLHTSATPRAVTTPAASEPPVEVARPPDNQSVTGTEKIIQAVNAQKKQAVYECDQCEYKTANKKMFIDHHRQHAQGAEMNVYKCEFCPYTATKYKNLTHHQKVHSRQVDEGYKCSYCYYVNPLKSRVSWHISAYHPGKEKKITEISRTSVPASTTSLSKKPVRITQSTDKVYKQTSLVNYEYKAPYATTSASVSSTEGASSTKVSTVPKYLEDDSLRDFERNLPKDMIYKHPVHCPLCPYNNRVRVNMLRHLKMHAKPKGSTTQAQQVPSSQSSQDEDDIMDDLELTGEEESEPLISEESNLPKDFLLFYKKSNGNKVLECDLCSYVHVNGSDMVRHFLCEHAVLGCVLCDDHAMTTHRMTEHFNSAHPNADRYIYLRRDGESHNLLDCDFKTLQKMEELSLLEESKATKRPSTGNTEVVADEDVMTTGLDDDEGGQAALKYCDRVNIGTLSKLKCKICDYITGLTMMKRHILTVHMAFFPYICKYCKQGCREKYTLQQHLKQMHPERPMIISKKRFIPEKHDKIVNSSGDWWKKQKRKRTSRGDEDDGSESERSFSLERSSQERTTPSQDSVCSESTKQSPAPSDKNNLPIPAANIKLEIPDPGLPQPDMASPPSVLSPRRVQAETARLREAREAREAAQAAEMAARAEHEATNGTPAPPPKKKFCCGYCDYSSIYLKQDIQRHILTKHLQIHVFMCKRCKYSHNTRKGIEQHRKVNKNHGFRDFTEIKDRVVDIHRDGLNVVYAFPEGQLTEIQQQLEKIQDLKRLDASPKKAAPSLSSLPITSTADSEMDTTQASSHENTSESASASASLSRNISPQSRSGVMAFKTRPWAQFKPQKQEIKLPKMELFCCAYCEYTSKYGRGDVKKHILFKHFMNKKYTCNICGFGTWAEGLMKTHTSSAHPGQSVSIYNNDFENECIVPMRTTSDQHLIMGVRVPQNSPVQLNKNILFQCKLCTVEGPNVVKIKHHIVVKHWNMKPFQCPVCQEQRWKRQVVIDHIKKEHPNCHEEPEAVTSKKAEELTNLVKKKVVFSSSRSSNYEPVEPEDDPALPAGIKCCICSVSFTTEQELEAHMTTHSIFACIYCPFQSMRKTEVQTHIEKDHPDYPVRIKTSMPANTPDQQSETSISDGESLKRKQPMDDPSQPPSKKLNFSPGKPASKPSPSTLMVRRYRCKRCEHSADKYRDIIEHICKHLNYYRFACSYCPLQVTRAYIMKNHLEKRHSQEEQVYKVQTDDAMEQEVKKGYTLVSAPAQVLSPGTSRSKEDPMDCPICGKKCGRQSTLREHLMREVNYRPFLCPLCDYAECSGGKVNFHMHSIHKGHSGRYQVKVSSDMAQKVQELMEQAKENARVGIVPEMKPQKPPYRGNFKNSTSATASATASASSSPSSSTSNTLVVKFPRAILKPKPEAGIEEEDDDQSSQASNNPEENNGHFSCHLCSYESTNEKLFKSHLMRTHGTKRWKCHYCDCRTVYRSTIIKHVRDSHRNMPMKIVQVLPTAKDSYTEAPDVEIIRTPSSFGRAVSQLKDLLPEDMASQRYTEPVLTKKASGAASSAPSVIAPPDADGLYHCQQCLYNTTIKKHMRMHLVSHRDADLECLRCSRLYRVIYRLRRHSRGRHKGMPVIWRNKTTGEEFEEPNRLVTHPSGELYPDSQTFCCHVCTYSTPSSDKLFRHVQETHPGATPSETPATPAATPAATPSRPSSRQSNASSQDPPMHKCPSCPHQAFLLEDLEQHIKSCHPAKPFRCGYCEFTFNYRSELLKHSVKRHPDQEPGVMNRAQRVVLKQEDMEHYIKTEAPPKPFQCGHCSHGCFYRSEVRVHHIRRHPDLQPNIICLQSANDRPAVKTPVKFDRTAIKVESGTTANQEQTPVKMDQAPISHEQVVDESPMEISDSPQLRTLTLELKDDLQRPREQLWRLLNWHRIRKLHVTAEEYLDVPME